MNESMRALKNSRWYGDEDLLIDFYNETNTLQKEGNF